MKKTIAMAVILSLVIALTSVVYAATEPVTAKLTVSNNEVKAGDTVTLTMKLENTPVLQWDFTVKYNSSVLDYDSSSLDVYKATAGELRFYGNRSSAIDTFTVTFKVKADAAAGETAIEVINLKEFGNLLVGKDYEVTTDGPVTVTVVKEVPPTNEVSDPTNTVPEEPTNEVDPGTTNTTPDEPTNEVEDPGTTNTTPTTPDEPENTDPTQKPDTYPQTGVNMFAVVAGIVLVAGVAFIVVKKYSK